MRKTRKAIMTLKLALVCIFAMASLAHAQKDKGQADLIFLTTALGSESYSIAVAQSQILAKYTPLMFTPQPSFGSAALIGLLGTGQGHLGIAGAFPIWEFYAGAEGIDKPYPMFRALQAGHEGLFAFITTVKTGIKTIPNLKGHKVIMTYPASRLHTTLGPLELQAYGLNPTKDVNNLKAENASKAVEELGNGRVDAVMVSLEGGKILELASKIGITVLPFDPQNVPTVSAKMPGIFPSVTTAGMTGIEAGVPCVMTPNLLFTRTDLPDDTAYLILKTLLEHHEELVPSAPHLLSQYTAQRAVKKLPIPYHEGAVRYYKERGLWTSDMDEHQAVLFRGMKR
jgi:uncharacterized protein